jgi:hypothetical protein
MGMMRAWLEVRVMAACLLLRQAAIRLTSDGSLRSLVSAAGQTIVHMCGNFVNLTPTQEEEK